jgi:hypothetical protein
VAAVDADLGFVLPSIPEHRAQWTGLDAVPAANAPFRLEADAATVARHQCLGRTDASAGRIGARSADDNHKTASHARSRPHLNARFSQTAITYPPRACKHAGLASDAAIDVDH